MREKTRGRRTRDGSAHRSLRKRQRNGGRMKPPIDSVRYRLGCLLVLVGWLAAAPPCRADEPEIKVHIVAILATEKFFPIVTRYQTKEKQRLILAIMVPPCEKKKK